MITKPELEKLAEKYETIDFIKDDPIQFPHRFMQKHHPEQSEGSQKDSLGKTLRMTEMDVEIAAFISSLLAYGNRKIFIKKLDELFKIMKNRPLEFVLNFDEKELKGFNYRFAKDFDVIEVFRILNKLYKEDGGLKALFEYGCSFPSPLGEQREQAKNEPRDPVGAAPQVRVREGLGVRVQQAMQIVTDYFYSNVKNEVGQGFYHLIPNPKNGGAMKRMNMFLRWMVRKPPVDLGIWDFIPASELLIPLDVHVARLSREMGLLNRSSNDFKAVLELSENLKTFDPQDPVKYDFAIFGLGVDGK